MGRIKTDKGRHGARHKRDIHTDTSRSEFENNLRASGFKEESRNGATNFTKGDTRYSVSDHGKNGNTADYFRHGVREMKIRLDRPLPD